LARYSGSGCRRENLEGSGGVVSATQSHRFVDEFRRTGGDGIAALHGKCREVVRSEGAKIKEDIRRSKRAEFDHALNEFFALRSDDFAPRHDLKGYPGDPSGLLNPIFDAKGRTCRLLKVLIDCAW